VIGIVDYGMGNLGSVQKTLHRIGAESLVSSNPVQLEACEKLILPGVGHFGKAVEQLKQRGLWAMLQSAALEKQIPILGICLGMQLMCQTSEEGQAEGLGWFDAEVRRFKTDRPSLYKIPHMGWNTLDLQKISPLFDGVHTEDEFYFVHSYYVHCKDASDVLCTTQYEHSFCSGIQKDNLYGFQFHPEKSHDAGSRLIANFVRL
jgi:imidazole glycerol-phosphate synthase subunit HisH